MVKVNVMGSYVSALKYRRYYEASVQAADVVWSNTNRGDYEADVWREKNRNEICLSMLDGIPKVQSVLTIGGGQWIDKELMASIEADRKVQTDFAKYDNIDLRADGTALPFKSRCFDLVISREMIEHVINAKALMEEMNRVLKVGGHLLLTTPNGYNFLPTGDHLRAFTPWLLLNIIKQEGFEVVDKRGNCPNIFRALLPLSRMSSKAVSLDEFKFIANIVDNFKDSYYIGSQLFVLARKVHHDKKQSTTKD